ncbi:hypothetical protein [Sinorhizobium meliloti]|uniref:hypothetical protein n=1 Tax=Rhizobium meliloti TaxID=382 RepID=UPI003F145C18
MGRPEILAVKCDVRSQACAEKGGASLKPNDTQCEVAENRYGTNAVDICLHGIYIFGVKWQQMSRCRDADRAIPTKILRQQYHMQKKKVGALR